MLIYPDVQIDKLPRMADFARWGYAIAEALGYEGERFLQAYQNNRNQSNDMTVSSNPTASAIIALMRNRNEWSGFAADLLKELEIVAQKEKIDTKDKLFPKATHILSRRLKEVKSNLEEAGFIITNGSQKKININRSPSNRLSDDVSVRSRKIANRKIIMADQSSKENEKKTRNYS